jgi:hypothetical protein
MPGPAKTTGANKSIRVAEGSALERLTQDKPFTETVHRMAELFEKALAENWGPQPVHVGIDWGGDPDKTVGVFVDEEGKVLHAQEVDGRRFVIGHDERTQEVVDEAQVLALARDLYPVGLVPIGVDDDEADELPVEVEYEQVYRPGPGDVVLQVKDPSAEPIKAEDDEDLSYLI